MRIFAGRRPLAVLVLLLSLAAGAQEPLPADVDPDSRSRLPYLGPDAPTGVAGIVAHGTGALVRWEFALGRALSELAVLTTARRAAFMPAASPLRVESARDRGASGRA